MKSLNKLQTIIFQVGGLLVVVGPIMPIVPAVQPYAAIVFTIGAFCFGCMQLVQRYEGRNIVIRRLRRQQIFGAFLLMLSALLMFAPRGNAGFVPIRGDEWKVTLAVAALLEVYTAFRLPKELEKDA